MFNLKIKTDNAAFDDGEKTNEVCRILEAVIESLKVGYQDGGCRDVNGNKVGDWRLR